MVLSIGSRAQSQSCADIAFANPVPAGPLPPPPELRHCSQTLTGRPTAVVSLCASVSRPAAGGTRSTDPAYEIWIRPRVWYEFDTPALDSWIASNNLITRTRKTTLY